MAAGGEYRTQGGNRSPRHRGSGEIGSGGGHPRCRSQVDADDLGRLALAAHRERLQARSEDFGAESDLPAAPIGRGEAEDLLAALYAAANFADARAARTVWMLRRLLGEAAGGLDIRAAWRVGGVEEREERLVHRKGLALGSSLSGSDRILASLARMETRSSAEDTPL